MLKRIPSRLRSHSLLCMNEAMRLSILQGCEVQKYMHLTKKCIFYLIICIKHTGHTYHVILCATRTIQSDMIREGGGGGGGGVGERERVQFNL